MCRNIKRLRNPGESATPQQSADAALQFVRKISGFRKPSKANQAAFDLAVREIAHASERLLASLGRQPNGKGYEIPDPSADFAGANAKT